jgi:aminoglycoside phosphotransferase (APT) family kinase protein
MATSLRLGDAAWEWLERSTGIARRATRIAPMKGSTSSSVFLVRGSSAASRDRFVLRVLDNAEWLAEEPDLAAHEAAALQEARQAGLRAPTLVAFADDDVPFGAPVVLMSFVAGKIVLCPADFQQWLRRLAAELASIHRHAAIGFPWGYRSWVDRAALAPPTWTTIPRAWERAIEVVLGTEPPCRPVFLHRDYHPTNVLWQGGGVSGVVDWINACRGPAGVDVAHCRTNLALMFGPTAADQFLDHYRAEAGEFGHPPYWDLDSILDSCVPGPEFYPPWREFGLAVIAPELLRQRLDAYLRRLIGF